MGVLPSTTLCLKTEDPQGYKHQAPPLQRRQPLAVEPPGEKRQDKVQERAGKTKGVSQVGPRKDHNPEEEIHPLESKAYKHIGRGKGRLYKKGGGAPMQSKPHHPLLEDKLAHHRRGRNDEDEEDRFHGVPPVPPSLSATQR